MQAAHVKEAEAAFKEVFKLLKPGPKGGHICRLYAHMKQVRVFPLTSHHHHQSSKNMMAGLKAQEGLTQQTEASMYGHGRVKSLRHAGTYSSPPPCLYRTGYKQKIEGCESVLQGMGEHMQAVRVLDEALEKAEGSNQVECLFMRGKGLPFQQ